MGTARYGCRAGRIITSENRPRPRSPGEPGLIDSEVNGMRTCAAGSEYPRQADRSSASREMIGAATLQNESFSRSDTHRGTIIRASCHAGKMQPRMCLIGSRIRIDSGWGGIVTTCDAQTGKRHTCRSRGCWVDILSRRGTRSASSEASRCNQQQNEYKTMLHRIAAGAVGELEPPLAFNAACPG